VNHIIAYPIIPHIKFLPYLTLPRAYSHCPLIPPLHVQPLLDLKMLWYEHQMQVKRSLHGESGRLADYNVVQHATPSIIREHATAWERANPSYEKHITSTESFTNGVPKKMVGGKAYWCAKPYAISSAMTYYIWMIRSQYRQNIDKISTEYRQNMNRISTKYQPNIN